MGVFGTIERAFCSFLFVLIFALTRTVVASLRSCEGPKKTSENSPEELPTLADNAEAPPPNDAVAELDVTRNENSGDTEVLDSAMPVALGAGETPGVPAVETLPSDGISKNDDAQNLLGGLRVLVDKV